MPLSYTWIGTNKPYLDSPTVDQLNDITIGRYGGNTTAHANKKEDGLLIWLGPENTWEFVMLLDAHCSSESAELIVQTIQSHKTSIYSILELPVEVLFYTMEEQLLDIFKSEQFLKACRTVEGESSCIITVRKENYLWWFSVGDCMLSLLHPDLMKLGQTLLNQRNFYEWIGRVNTFELEVPCYSTGCRELRTGHNVILMATDGYIHEDREIGTIVDIYNEGDIHSSVGAFLDQLHQECTVDSTTIIAWCIENHKDASRPSVLKE